MSEAEALTVGAAFLQLRAAFEQGGLETSALDARILVRFVAGIDARQLALNPDLCLGRKQAIQLKTVVERRLKGEPVARIIGEREFWGLPFRLSPATLVPRPDSETVVAAALSTVLDRQAPLTVLDIGAGSGCLIVALLHELPNATGFAVDRSEDAARYTRDNAWANGVGERVQVLVSDWTYALEGNFDLIVTNPPYIREGDLAELAPEVRDHDPVLALTAGESGLDAYRALAPELNRLLTLEGVAVVEIGRGQLHAVCELAHAASLQCAGVHADLSRIPRAITFKRAPGK